MEKLGYRSFCWILRRACPQTPSRAIPKHYEKCLEFRVDITSEPIPVVPAGLTISVAAFVGGPSGRRIKYSAALPLSVKISCYRKFTVPNRLAVYIAARSV